MHTDELTIREAGPQDARLLSVLATVTFYEAYFEQDTPEDMADYLTESFNVGQIAKELADPNSTFFIAYRAGVAVGYAKLIRNSYTDGVSDNSIELKRIYIIERYWRKGFGEKLLNHCIERVRDEGAGAMWLGVWERNERGLQFYRKHGFERVGTLTFPYGDSVGINHVLERTL